MQGLSGSTLTDSGWDLNKKRHSPDSCFSCPSRILLVWRGGGYSPWSRWLDRFPYKFCSQQSHFVDAIYYFFPEN